MLESLPNGAIIFDRFGCEVDGQAAEVIFAFLPGNPMTPLCVWHRAKNGALYWGHYHPGNEADQALAYFKERKAYYRKQREDALAARAASQNSTRQTLNEIFSPDGGIDPTQ